jgi:hypothetical protein
MTWNTWDSNTNPWDSVSFAWDDNAMSFVSGVQAATTSVTLGTHAAGDLLLAFAYRDGNTTAPSLPSGWTDIASSGANSNSARVGYKIAASGAETSGTWTNANHLHVHVYRGFLPRKPYGAVQPGGASSSTLSFTGLTMVDPSGSSWVVGFAGHRSTNTTVTGGSPSGMIIRTAQDPGASESAGHDTNQGVSSWTTTTQSVGGTSSGWRTYTIELVLDKHHDISLLGCG